MLLTGRLFTISSDDQWKGRRRQWNMPKGKAIQTNREDLNNMELWWRKDGDGCLQLVESQLLPALRFCER